MINVIPKGKYTDIHTSGRLKSKLLLLLVQSLKTFLITRVPQLLDLDFTLNAIDSCIHLHDIVFDSNDL